MKVIKMDEDFEKVEESEDEFDDELDDLELDDGF